MHELNSRTIVLKKETNFIYLSESVKVNIENISGKINDRLTFCRIKNYDRISKTLYLKIEHGGLINGAFEMSSASNDKLLSIIEIDKVIVERKQLFPTAETTKTPIKKEVVVIKHFDDFPKRDKTASIKIKVIDLKFEDQKVCFFSKVPPISTFNNYFEVSHYFIKPQYDAIKPYFAKFFDKGKIEFKFTFTFTGERLLDKKAESSELLNINQELLDKVENAIIKDNIINSNEENITSLKDALKNTFIEEDDKDEKWLLSKIITPSETKHYFHLTHLSEFHAKGKTNIKVTGKPFSFIFCIESSEHFYIIWEPYNTDEATYIWRYKNNGEDSIQKGINTTEELIKQLRLSQKMTYRKQQKENSNFLVLEHEYKLEKYGFDNWLTELKMFLI